MKETTVINLTVSGANEQGVKGYVELLRENVTHESLWHQVKERVIKFGDGSMGSYWLGNISLTVDANQLNNCLVQVESVRDGYAPDPKGVLEHIYKDMRVEVAKESIVSQIPTIELNQYLHNKVQEQSRAIENLELETFKMNTTITDLTQRMTAMEYKYEVLQTFLSSYVDLPNLVKVVRALAEKVDEEVLDVYPLVNTVH